MRSILVQAEAPRAHDGADTSALYGHGGLRPRDFSETSPDDSENTAAAMRVRSG